jgi:periplasmic protein TonB
MQFWVVCILVCVSLPSYSQQVPAESEEIFTVVEQPAVFPGGMAAFNRYIEENLTYPRKEKRKHIEGKVFVSFVVQKDGSVSDVTCIKGIAEALDQESIRIIQNSPFWRPAKLNGTPVVQHMVVPVEFKLKKK